MKYDKTAKRLTYALERIGINQQALADKSGVSKHSISQYVNGYHSPSNISAAKMSEVLEVNPMWLMGYDVPMISSPIGGMNLESIYERMKEMDMTVLNAYNKADEITKRHVRLLLGIEDA